MAGAAHETGRQPDGHEDVQNWTQEYIDVDAGDLLGKEVIELDCECHNVNKGSPDAQQQHTTHKTNGGDAPVMGDLSDPLYPMAWNIPPVMEQNVQELLGDDNQTIDRIANNDTALVQFSNQALQTVPTNTTTSFNSLSYTGLWTGDDPILAATTTSSSNVPTPASFTNLSASTPSPFPGLTMGGTDMSPSISFSSNASTMARQASSSSLAAVAMSHNSSGSLLDPAVAGTPSYFAPSSSGMTETVQTKQTGYASTQAAFYTTASSTPLDNTSALASSTGDVGTNAVDYNSLSMPIAYAFNPVVAASGVDMQQSLSAQSGSSAGTCLSQSARHLLFAPSMIPKAFHSDQHQIEAGDGVNNAAPRRNRKRGVDDSAENKTSAASRKKRKTSSARNAGGNLVQSHQHMVKHSGSRSTSEEPFILGEYVHLPTSKISSVPPMVPVPSMTHASVANGAGVVYHNAPTTEEHDPLNSMTSADHLDQNYARQYALDQRPFTPDNNQFQKNQGVHDDRSTVSPQDLQIQANHNLHHAHDRAQILAYDGHHDDPEAVRASHDLQHLHAAAYNYVNDDPYYHHQQYHYPPPPHHPLHAPQSRASIRHVPRVALPTSPVRNSAPVPPVDDLTPPTLFGDHPTDNYSSSASPPPHVSSTPPTVVVDTERARKDALLLKLRREGYTYQEIRRRYHFTEAESTMRGRFRALTKPKEERVRKPQWTTKDDQLLVAAVQRMARGRTVGRDFKVPWKAVSESIADGGGSYRFGNTTCRKRYDQLVGDGLVTVVRGLAVEEDDDLDTSGIKPQEEDEDYEE
ncbi:hypothetical protein SEUCBS139899_010421 [Sporothrix eucalyptigena]